MKKYSLHILLLCATIFVAVSCKRTKDTFTSRTYHGMVSKYNPLFNGEQALLKLEKTLSDQHVDNFEEILPVYKIGTEKQASAVKPDIEKAIEKGSKVIQEHSMMIRNSQKNKVIDDAYLLVGKARYYDRDYFKSLETFNYIIQEYPKSKDLYTCRLWAAKCKTAVDNYLSAKEDFEVLYREKDMPKKLKPEVYASYAQLEINGGTTAAAFQLLRQAVDKTKNKQKRVRWLYICGQLQSKMGNDYEASEIFAKVIKMGPPYELLFNAQLNRARNYDVDLQNPDKAFDELKAMLRDDKNYENRDQIYYVMAEVAEKLEEEEMMVDYLKNSVKVSTTNQKQKALSYLKLADTKFKNKDYPIAAAYYDSTYANLDPKDSRYARIKRKKESLDGLVKNLNTIELQDSLQMLAGLSEKQRHKIIDNIIFDLKEAEEEKLRASNNNFNNINNPTGADNGSNTKGGQWYFYNQNLRGIGERDFNNKYGNRALEDNWRRKNKETVNNFEGNPASNDGSTESETGGESENPLYNRETYIKEIPLTDSLMALSHEQIIKAFMGVGRIYKDELTDYNAAAKALEELLQRYPQMEELGRVWYTLYRIYTLNEDATEAKRYRDLILSVIPESEYARLINNEGNIDFDADKNEINDLYTQAYNQYLGAQYSMSLSLTDKGLLSYASSDYAPKFQLLKAYNHIKLGKKDAYIADLKLTVDRFGDTEQGIEAQKILNKLGEKIKTQESEAKGDSEEKEQTETTSKYKTGATKQHKYIVVVPNTGGVTNKLQIALTDFNKKYFSIDRLNTKAVFLDLNNQIVLVSNFDNASRAMDYYRTLINEEILIPYIAMANGLKHFVISSENFQELYRTKKPDEYLEFFNKNYIKEEK